MRVFKSRWFERFARREGIADLAMREAIARAQKGLVDADLGGNVIKQRIARSGHGKSAGYRAIILFRRGERAFFVYGFAKAGRRTSTVTNFGNSGRRRNMYWHSRMRSWPNC